MRIVFAMILAVSAMAGTAWAEPVRESTIVKFFNPVRVGDRVLMGEYIIEHDTARMDRGGPCTHIYSVKDPLVPIVTFHCKHLLRAPARTGIVTLRRDYNMLGQAYVLTEFQFAGSSSGHGVPGVHGVPIVKR